MKKTLLDYEYNNKTVLLRCDFNVPIDNGVITDDKRIVASLKTINYVGTEEQWNAMTKDNNWNYGVSSDMVINYNYVIPQN